MAATSAHVSFSTPSAGAHRQRRHPPAQPHAHASAPPRAQRPPTNPPRRCPPTSPNRWRLIQMEAAPSVAAEVMIVEGDQRMSDESVEVERRVGMGVVAAAGRQESEVTPASWPISRASKVIENCRVLKCG